MKQAYGTTLRHKVHRYISLTYWHTITLYSVVKAYLINVDLAVVAP